MAINLIKGQRVEIESGLTRLKVEMGWKVNPNADPAYDLDASTFLLGNKIRCLFSSTAHEESGSAAVPKEIPKARMASRRVQGFDISKILILKIGILKVTNV